MSALERPTDGPDSELAHLWLAALAGADRRHVVLRRDWPELAKALDALADSEESR